MMSIVETISPQPNAQGTRLHLDHVHQLGAKTIVLAFFLLFIPSTISAITPPQTKPELQIYRVGMFLSLHLFLEIFSSFSQNIFPYIFLLIASEAILPPVHILQR